MGRKRIEMKIVKNRGSRQVTFLKRRNGLFKKANELATLCAAEVAVVVFSPGGKPFSFGNPSVDVVSQCFLNQASMQKPHANDPKHEGGVQDLNHEFNDVMTQLQKKKKRGKELEKVIKANLSKSKYKKSIDQLSTNELSEMKTAFEELRENMRVRASEIEASSSLLLLKKDYPTIR